MNSWGVLLGATALLGVGCDSEGESSTAPVSTGNKAGVLSVEFVRDTTVDYADYSDGYELFVDLSGPVDERVVGDVVSEHTVLIERALPPGRYRVRAGLLPCETLERPCGPERDSCETKIDIGDERYVLMVDYQPGRPCNIEFD